MKYILTVVATVAVIGIIAVVFPYTGFYNVAASEGHSGLEEWYLSTMSRRSIQARADEIVAPATLTDSTTIALGAFAYHGMCQTCHGGPGVDRSVTGQGITPTPPSLYEDSTHWQSNEVFWIVKHGIKMAGMPAYGPTHSDEELWELVAFVKHLPDMTDVQYAELTQPDTTTTHPVADDGHNHVH